jgi:hypothetical protein
MLIRNEIASRCAQESTKKLPDLLEDHAKNINYPVVRLSFEAAMKDVAAAAATCEVKYKRVIGLMALQAKVEKRAPVEEWAEAPPQTLAWDALQTLIALLHDDDDLKLKLLDLSASHKMGETTMDEILGVCRTAQRSCSLKRKQAENSDALPSKRLFTLDDSKNGSCTSCKASDHKTEACPQTQGKLLNVPSQGIWNPARWQQQQDLQLQIQSPPPGWIQEQLAAQLSQAAQGTGAPASAQRQGGGDGGSSQGQGHNQYQAQGGGGSYSSPSRTGGRPARCGRCGAKDHLIQQCKQESDKCFNCNTYGHRSRECQQPPRQEKCYNCNGVGHKAPACQQPPRQRAQAGSAMSGTNLIQLAQPQGQAGECGSCGRQGHTSVGCLYRNK